MKEMAADGFDAASVLDHHAMADTPGGVWRTKFSRSPSRAWPFWWAGAFMPLPLGDGQTPDPHQGPGTGSIPRAERLLEAADLALPAFTFDGDTPGSLRTTVRAEGRLVITNPDMLHAGVLPNHPKWARFLRALRFVVIDELHTYRGIFGSHLTNVLRRVAAFYGAHPRFLCCSATIGNPRQLAQRILEQEVELIDDNGAPAGERHFVLYNPPLVDRG